MIHDVNALDEIQWVKLKFSTCPLSPVSKPEVTKLWSGFQNEDFLKQKENIFLP